MLNKGIKLLDLASDLALIGDWLVSPAVPGDGTLLALGLTSIKKGLKKKLSNKLANKLHHVFSKPGHKLSSLLNKFGGNQEKAYNAINKATQSLIDKKGLKGKYKINVKIKGENITVKGKVINGKAEIGTFFKP